MSSTASAATVATRGVGLRSSLLECELNSNLQLREPTRGEEAQLSNSELVDNHLGPVAEPVENQGTSRGTS